MLLSDLLHFFTTIRWRERSEEIKLETPVWKGRTEGPTLQATAWPREGHFPRNAHSAPSPFEHGVPGVSPSDQPFMGSYCPNPQAGTLPAKLAAHLQSGE